MKPEKILTIRLGATCTYLVPGKNGYLLIDGGYRLWDRWFFRRLEKAGIQPQQIRLVVITHVHFDHVGTLGAVATRCRCPVAVHAKEAALLTAGKIVIPPGTNLPGKMVKKLSDRFPGVTTRICAFQPVAPDIRVEGEKSLESRGFEARIIPTPGHTEGSLSVLTEAGNAFVGDIAVNLPVFGRARYASPFGYSPRAMAASLEQLIRKGAQRFYPAHGQPFDATDWLNSISA